MNASTINILLSISQFFLFVTSYPTNSRPRLEIRPGDLLVHSQAPGKFRAWVSKMSLLVFGMTQTAANPGNRNPSNHNLGAQQPGCIGSLLEWRGVLVKGGVCDGEERMVINVERVSGQIKVRIASRT